MRVVIAGSSGLIGTALKKDLREGGHTVVALVRHPAENDQESSWNPTTGRIDVEAVAAADVVVNLAGASIGGRRLTDSYAEVVRSSRVDSTSTLVGALIEGGFSGTLLQGSAMGYYGDRGEERLTESSGPGATLLSGIVEDWEAAAAPAVEAGVRTVFARTGLVLAAHGGFAERLLPLATRGLLRSLGSGETWHSWITLEDHIRALRFLIDSDHHGPAIAVAPAPARDAELLRAISDAAGVRPGFAVPSWVLRAAIGRAVEDLLTSQHAVPGVLADLGFEWHHPTIEVAARWIMAQR